MKYCTAGAYCQALELASRRGDLGELGGRPPFSPLRAVRMAFHGACVNATLYHVFLTSLKCAALAAAVLGGIRRTRALAAAR